MLAAHLISDFLGQLQDEDAPLAIKRRVDHAHSGHQQALGHGVGSKPPEARLWVSTPLGMVG